MPITILSQYITMLSKSKEARVISNGLIGFTVTLNLDLTQWELQSKFNVSENVNEGLWKWTNTGWNIMK